MIRKNWEGEREWREKRWKGEQFNISQKTNKKCIHPEDAKMFCRINHEQHANQNHNHRDGIKV